MDVTHKEYEDKDYRKEMEDLILSERAKQEATISRRIAEDGEMAANVPQVKKSATHELSTSSDMLQILSEQAGIPYIQLTSYKLGNVDVLQLIPAELARMYKVFPIRVEEDQSLLVAISDPLNITIGDDLRLLLERSITPVVASEEEILDSIELYYGMGDETIEKMVEEFEKEEIGQVEVQSSREVDLSDLERIANEPPVIKLVNLLLLQAIKDRASDLHIEPFGSMLRIRYRVDGVLREIPSPPKSLQLGLCSRLKVMSNLNISETRLPQDGRIRLTIQGREVDLRVSTIPTVHGESIVMRILDKSMMMLGIAQLGMTKEVLEKFLKLIHLPNGIILVTGPTGCGKTTTLYAAVSEINSPEDKIITTEDPVEYELPGIVQININPKVGLTFAACLRSILRQDPDIILVGEVRDLETAQTAVQASLTGHLVFSTLHTNSAAGTITRLVDMGVEPFLITSTMEAVVGQRLIRTICPNCRRPFEPTPDELGEFGVTPQDVADIVFYKGSGCDECSFTGYKGRIGIFELLIITEEIKDLILRRASTDEIQAMALHLGMTSMRQDGWLKICLGLTTFDEVARQTPQESKEQIAEEMERVVKETIERVAASKIQRKPARSPIKEPVSAPADQAPDAPSQPWSGEEAIQPYKVGDATETQE